MFASALRDELKRHILKEENYFLFLILTLSSFMTVQLQMTLGNLCRRRSTTKANFAAERVPSHEHANCLSIHATVERSSVGETLNIA